MFACIITVYYKSLYMSDIAYPLFRLKAIVVVLILGLFP